MPTTVTTYGPGGYDPTLPDNNVISVEELPDPPSDEAVELRWLEAAMAEAGLLDSVEALIAAMPMEAGGHVARASWRTGGDIRRRHPLILALQAALSLDDATVDGLWARAAEIAA